MQCRGILFSMLIASLDVIAITSQGRAESEKYCPVLFEEGWSFSGKVLACKQGDTLIAQMTHKVAPAAIVARYCDLHFSIFSETQPGTNQVTVVCTFIEERQPRK
jgi:hypothetical protein